jgi:hypothetical protein
MPYLKRLERQFAVCVLLTLLAWRSGEAQAAGVNVSKVGTTAATFLEIPVGARAIGMGRAFVSTANDISSLYWNPAGLARLTLREATFNQIDWIADMSFNYAGIGVPLGDLGSLGLSFSALTMDDMPVRTIERPQGTGELFSAGSFAVGLHYARNLSDRFAIGFTGKYISEKIWNMQSQAFALDLGVLFTTSFFNGVRVGAAISNFGTDMRLTGRDTRQFNRIDDRKLGSNDRIPMNIELDSWPLPLNFQFGIAAELFQTESHVLTVEADALHPSANYESVNVGLEYSFQDLFYVRAGHHSLFLTDGEGGLSFGAGVTADLFGGNFKARFDYAYSDLGRLKGINVLAVSLFF